MVFWPKNPRKANFIASSCPTVCPRELILFFGPSEFNGRGAAWRGWTTKTPAGNDRVPAEAALVVASSRAVNFFFCFYSPSATPPGRTAVFKNPQTGFRSEFFDLVNSLVQTDDSLFAHIPLH